MTTTTKTPSCWYLVTLVYAGGCVITREERGDDAADAIGWASALEDRDHGRGIPVRTVATNIAQEDLSW